ncbi:MAG: DUF1996 domain-containing protein [Actinomycetota bacterium]|nr:DUF1996 domain-containing protein [Actinomycetota bacterium]
MTSLTAARNGRWARIVVAVLVATSLTGGVETAEAADFREGDVSFKVTCNYLKSAPFDPIVAPDQPGASHLHDFFGNKDIAAGTDSYAELQAAGAGRTTCNDTLDLSGYWAPSLYEAGSGVQHKAQRMTGYYRRQQKDAAIQPYPDGLAVITGWKQGDGAGPNPAVKWQCTGLPAGSTPPARSCPSGSYIQVSVSFPDCWDGTRRDSANHRDHMAFSVPDSSGAFVCPPTHPAAVPELTIYLNYNTLTSGNVRLSSGPWYTLHADFLNGWDRARLSERIDTCLVQLQKCASGA